MDQAIEPDVGRWYRVARQLFALPSHIGIMVSRLVTIITIVALVGCGSGERSSEPASSREIRFDVPSLTIAQGGGKIVTASVVNARGEVLPGLAFTFEAGDTTILTVMPTTGNASAFVAYANGRAGSTFVTVRTQGLSAQFSVTVTPVPGRIDVSPRAPSIPQGGSVQLAPRLLDRAEVEIPGASFRFSNHQPEIATVSPTGLVTSLGPAGVATVVIEALMGGATVSTSVSEVAITPIVTSLEVTPNPVIVNLGSSALLRTTVFDATGAPIANAPVTYTSANPALADVTPSGVVYSLGALGSTTIAVRVDSLRRDITVNVVAAGTPAWNVVATTPAPGAYGVAFAGASYFIGRKDDVPLWGTLPSFALTGRIASGSRSLAVAADPNGRAVYMAGDASRALFAYDALTGQLLWTAGPDQGQPLDVIVSKDGATVYVSTDQGEVLAVDALTHAVLWTAAVPGTIPVHLALHPSRPLLYAAGNDNPIVVELDLGSRSTRDLRVGGAPRGLAVSPDGGTLFVALEETATLVAWDLTIDAPSKLVGLPCGPWALALAPSQREMVISCPTAGRVLFLDIATRTVRQNTRVTGGPRRIAFGPGGTLVVVANELGWIDFLR